MPVFLIFLAAYVLSQFFRSFLAVIAPELSAELALGPQELGNLQALWILGFVMLQLPVGFALDRFGPRRTVSTLMTLTIAGSLLFANAWSVGQLYAAMLINGAGCSAIYMGALYVFGRTYPQSRFAFLSSWLIGIGSAGNLLAATPLAHAVEAVGWRMAMTAVAAAAAISLISIAVLIRDPQRHESHHGDGAITGLISILRIKALWPLLPLVGIGYAVVLAERGLWAGPYFADVHGLDAVARGNGLLIMAAAMSVGALVYGPLDQLLGTRKWVVATGSLVTAIGFIVLGTLPMTVATATITLAAVGAFGMTYGVLMAHGRALIPDRLLGRGITFLNLLFIGGAGVLQPISGAFMERAQAMPQEAYARLHLTFGVLLLLALAVYLAAREAPPRR